MTNLFKNLKDLTTNFHGMNANGALTISFIALCTAIVAVNGKSADESEDVPALDNDLALDSVDL